WWDSLGIGNYNSRALMRDELVPGSDCRIKRFRRHHDVYAVLTVVCTKGDGCTQAKKRKFSESLHPNDFAAESTRFRVLTEQPELLYVSNPLAPIFHDDLFE